VLIRWGWFGAGYVVGLPLLSRRLSLSAPYPATAARQGGRVAASRVD